MVIRSACLLFVEFLTEKIGRPPCDHLSSVE